MSALQWEWSPDVTRSGPGEGPVLVAAFEGWNDAGDAATAAIEHLDLAWSGEVFAEIDPEEFHDFTVTRPRVRLEGDDRVIDWPGHTFVWAEPAMHSGVVLLRAVEPQLRWRTYCEHVLEVARALNCRLVVTLGSLLADVPHTRPSPVFGTAYDDEVIGRLRMQPSRYEGPTGIVGVLHAACRDAGIDSASLWAAVPAYVPSTPAPRAAQSLLERVAPLIGAAADAPGLIEAARGYEREIDELIADDDSTVDYVRRLEEQFDAERAVEESNDRMMSSDGLIDELERFLREQ
jgi:proteasome assembly chaperone (PAC2) family protein